MDKDRELHTEQVIGDLGDSFEKVFQNDSSKSKDLTTWTATHQTLNVWTPMTRLNNKIRWQDVHIVCKRLKARKVARGDGLLPKDANNTVK